LVAKAEKINEQETQVKMAMLPLLALFPGKHHPLILHPPDRFFMVRYDFFAELILVGKRVRRFILLGATFKGKHKTLTRNPVKRLFARALYANFEEISFSTKKDFDFFCSYVKTNEDQIISVHDFRHGQIIDRQKKRPGLSGTRCLDEFKGLMAPYELCDRLILGSVWPSELDIFNDDFLQALKDKKLFVFVAPHKLKGDDWDYFHTWFQGLQDHGIEAALWDHVGIHGKGNVILCKEAGLLCELYSFFGHSFIGGGHGRSIHSLLEPFWGGGHIYCGPKVGRSTEYDYVSESSPSHIHLVYGLKDFYSLYQEKRLFALDVGVRENLAVKIEQIQEEKLDSFCEGSKS
jgi:3-deoxy-D-manno-octulosonic-acid transferase